MNMSMKKMEVRITFQTNSISWHDALSKEHSEDVPALAHSRQTIALDNVANTYGEGEPNPTIPIDIPEILPSLSPSLSAYNSGSEGSEPITPVDAPRIEAFLGPAPIVGRTTDEIISTQQLSEHLSDRIEAMEMLAMQAIEHVCRNVNTWFLSNNSIPNHFGLQKDYADLMLNVLRKCSPLPPDTRVVG